MSLKQAVSVRLHELSLKFKIHFEVQSQTSQTESSVQAYKAEDRDQGLSYALSPQPVRCVLQVHKRVQYLCARGGIDENKQDQSLSTSQRHRNKFLKLNHDFFSTLPLNSFFMSSGDSYAGRRRTVFFEYGLKDFSHIGFMKNWRRNSCPFLVNVQFPSRRRNAVSRSSCFKSDSPV